MIHPDVKRAEDLCVQHATGQGKTRRQALNCADYSAACPDCPFLKSDHDLIALLNEANNAAPSTK